jgi:hypothetical protein
MEATPPECYRWTLESEWIFITSKTEYEFEGHCERFGKRFALDHGERIKEIKYDDRTNLEFIA